MARMIDADELLKTNIRVVGSIKTPSGKIQNINAIQVTEILSAPTIDAVPVVRCKDCKYLSHLHNGMSLEIFEYLCSLTSREVNLDDFCSYGERRESDNARVK